MKTLVLALVVLGAGVLIVRSSAGFLMEEVPARGGGFTEALIGTPRFINPVLALSFADQDLAALVFEGLMTATPDGLAPALAESYSVTDDGLQYTFIIREDATFHDGEPVTSADVVHTILRIQDPAIKSPLFVNWGGIIVEAVSEREVRFYLPEPYAPFIENTTVGILPLHLWEDIAADEFPFSELNSHPVGAGPYRIREIRRDDASIPRQYDLRAFSNYVLGEPLLTDLTFLLARSEEDALSLLSERQIDAFARATPALLSQHERVRADILSTPLPRLFTVFFNVNRASIFARSEVREALDRVIDRDVLVQEALGGYATPIAGPVPLGVFENVPLVPEPDRDAAETLLENSGWERGDDGIWVRETDTEFDRLSFSLATADSPELVRAATYLEETWRAFGVDVTLEVFDSNDLTQSTIRPRRFDALLFGMVVGRELDLFAFWHSSQRNDPGLNIAQYANVTVDAALERSRAATNPTERLLELTTFAEEVHNELPALFLYSPDLIYLAPSDVRNISIMGATTPAERFMTIHTWYQRTRPSWNLW